MNQVRAALSARPGDPLIVSDRRSRSCAEVLEAADSISSSLRRRGARRVLVRSADPAALVAALVGSQEAVADLVLAHANLAEAFVDRVRDQLGVDAVLGDVFADDPVATSAEPAGAGAGGVVFLMTSGTTGLPKVIGHRPEGLIAKAGASAGRDDNRRSRWLLTYLPSAFAGVQVILTACLTEGALVEPAERTPAGFAEAASRHRVTHLSGTPTFWRSFLLACEPPGLGALRQITLGGEAADQALLDRLAAAFPGARVTQIYASTEGGVLFSVSDARAGFPAGWLGDGVRGVRLRVRDGELEVLSPCRMVEFHAQEHDAPESGDGWLATGDLVRVEGDRVRFVGRRDAMINVGGAKVYPQEVESFLLGLPGVSEARVSAVSSPISGQVLVADVVPAAGDDPESLRQAVLRACWEELPRAKVPAVVRVVASIPVSESGKKA